jgi:hypothetical protein
VRDKRLDLLAAGLAYIGGAAELGRILLH